MKKACRFTLITVISILFMLVLGGCSKTESVVSSISLKDNDPSVAIEIALGEFDFDEYTLVVAYESGITEQISLTRDMISDSDQFLFYQVGDHDINVNYGGKNYTFKISVKRAKFEDLFFPENNVFVYDGKAHTVEVDGEIPANAVVTYLGANSFVNAGTYDVVAIVSCEGYVTEKLSTTVKIERARYDMSGVSFEGKEVVYDGNAHSIRISGTLPEGVSAPKYTINDKLTSEATDVGDYTVKATFANNDPNYEAIPAMTAILKITPAEYTVNGVDIVFLNEKGNIISDSSKIYDGNSVAFDLNDYGKISNKLTVTFSVFDDTGKLISSSNKNTGIKNAGVYTVKVDFKLNDGKNYKPISPLTRTFEVRKAEYPPIDNITFMWGQTTYDGKEHSISIDESRLPSGVTVSYEYYLNGELVVDEQKNPVKAVVDAGRYTVKAIFTHNDINRNPIPSMSAKLNIDRMKVNTSLVGISAPSSIEYGDEFVYTIVKWQDINAKDYDILNYREVRFYKYQELENGLFEYVDVGNELPKEVGIYRVSLAISIVEDFKRNYCFADGESAEIIYRSVEVKKKNLPKPEVTFDNASEIVYTGQAHTIRFGGIEESELMTMSTAYFKYDYSIGKYVEIDGMPVNVGSYKFVITLNITDRDHFIFSDGESKAECSFEFDITKKLIDVTELFNHIPSYELNSVGNLALKTFDDLDPDIKKYLEAVVQRIDRLWSDDFSEEVYGISETGLYRVQYTIKVTYDIRENVALIYRGYETYVVDIFHTFYVV